MNIYEFAMQMEKDGENYYRELAGQTDNVGLKNILNMLAIEEVNHYKILEQLSKNDETAEIESTNILKDAKNIFIEMRKQDHNLKSDIPQSVLYRKAYEIEEKSYQYYLEKSAEAENETQKEILFRLAEEEKKHMFLMDHLVEFVSRPETWLENAEFNQMEEY